MKTNILQYTALLAGVAAALAACSPTVSTRGNLLSDTKMAQIQPLMSSKADVSQYWGPPSTMAPFDPNIWYYIGETTSQTGIYEPKVKKRRVIRVTFDANENVMEMAELDPKNGREIEVVDRKTPTAGREFTAFQQFIGNLGKFNRDGAGEGD